MDWQRYANPAPDVSAVLGSLVVGKGGRGQRKNLAPDWAVGFYENTGINREQPFKLILYYKSRESVVGLKRADVFTKSKSMWQRDSVWRLKPETVQRLALDIERLLADPRNK
jgi:hypothetical protein